MNPFFSDRLFGKIGIFLQVVLWLAPWSLRRWVLIHLYGWSIAVDAHIGRSILLVRDLSVGLGGRIGHLTFIRLDACVLGNGAIIGHRNWISGFPKGNSSAFADAVERRPHLVVEDHAIITNSHRIDCTDEVTIGAFTTIAGWHSQIVTHGIDIGQAQQRCAPVRIGRYCLVGTKCVIVKGAQLPDFCLLGAGSTLTKKMQVSYRLYSGVPAIEVRSLDPESAYFVRQRGPCF